jgi:hypothetical protein
MALERITNHLLEPLLVKTNASDIFAEIALNLKVSFFESFLVGASIFRQSRSGRYSSVGSFSVG